MRIIILFYPCSQLPWCRRYFIGGGPSLHDLNFVTRPADFTGKVCCIRLIVDVCSIMPCQVLNKHPVRTVTSGRLRIRLNVIVVPAT